MSESPTLPYRSLPFPHHFSIIAIYYSSSLPLVNVLCDRPLYGQCIVYEQIKGCSMVIQSLFLSFYLTMEKPVWRKIDRSQSKPCPRWGHTCCVVGEEIVFFGGYADSNYMNDLWSYHSASLQWKEVVTTGDRPSHRSNCSMNYDPHSNQIVVFGGGGPNKQRFNSIHLLDWNTKNWVEIAPKENEPAPWERTYHVAEVRYPYLAVFGGEGVADMDDLWLFNFQTLSWKEAKFERDATRPCARRFHSSCLIGNELFIVAGCHGKYRCLSDVYSLDLTPALQRAALNELKWQERKLRGASFLSRWGHSSAVYDGKIYVFAGRFSNDLNDLLVIDVQNNSLKSLKLGGNPNDHPKPRRRHCAGFVGSCMIAFGGFNGEYFNDLHYVNVFELIAKQEQQEETLKSYLNSSLLADGRLTTREGEVVPIHSAVIARYFRSYENFTDYLEDVDGFYPLDKLLTLLECFYRGYGRWQVDDTHLRHSISFSEIPNRRALVNTLLVTEENQRNCLKLAHLANDRTLETLVSLSPSDYALFQEARRNCWFTDVTLLSQGREVRANRLLLAMGSVYFKSLFSGSYQTGDSFELGVDGPLEVLLDYLTVGAVVVRADMNNQQWMALARLGEYLCLPHFKSVCEAQLTQRVSCDSLLELELFAEELELSSLSLHCANYELRSSVKSNELKRRVSAKEAVGKASPFLRLYETVKFDLFHNNQVEKEPLLRRKNVSESEAVLEEKENNRECNHS